MANIEQKIKEVTEKLEKDIKKKDLGESDIQGVLGEIDDGLVEIKKSAEKDQKEIVEKGIALLRKKIEEKVSDSDSLVWWRIKGFLEKDIKGGLDELKNEITRLEEPEQSLMIVRGGSELEKLGNRSELEELTEWRKLFPKQSPEMASKNLRELVLTMAEVSKRSNELQNKLENAKSDPKSSNFSGFLREMNETINGDSGLIMSCTKAGEKTMPLFGTAAGALGGGAWSIPLVLTQSVMYFGDKTGTDLKELTEEGIKVTAGLTENVINIGAESVESWRKGMENVTVVTLENTAEVAKSFFGIFKDESKSLEEKNEAAEKYIKTLQEQSKKQEEEFNQRLKNREDRLEEQKKDFEQRLNNRDERIAKQEEEFKQRIEKKEKRIEVLEEKIEKLETKNENLQKEKEALLIAQVEVGHN